MSNDGGLAGYEAKLLRVGRNAAPLLLAEWWDNGSLSETHLRDLLPAVWTDAEWPEQILGQRRWVRLFKASGFLSSPPRDPPHEPIVAYRGCSHHRKRGLSWTSSLQRAEWFARRTRLFGLDAVVVTMVVAPKHILALLDDVRQESELVVNMPAIPSTAIDGV